ncbi:hypothetical protein D9619_012067 [Psilocybe cf. subviscida]|uniref:pyranose dehydrogenase (acceptor) n=1 Tax=Psilocybe cf. subviscida TaxID=2480587 RepID=A0A8H5EZA1_9AGAR|nr:hypothetical protein D9619_012067 [Psilocybe cf. subviscida]
MLPAKLLSLVLVSLSVTPSLAATITSALQLKTKTYDYVIVGAGTAGLVLANRLSADPSVSVLVLEAGVSDDGVVPVQAPFLGPTVTPNTPWDWNYTIVPQVGMDGRTFSYPRGKLLGGSSSANYLFHQFGSSEDWNRLAKLTGDSNWQWSNMRKFIQTHEKVVPPIDGHNTTDEIIPADHGFNGMLPTSLPGFNQTIDSRVLQTIQQLPDDFPYNEDMSGGDHSLLGFGFVKSSAGGGKRSSSSTTYLAAANGRPNLTVLIHATVQKLVQTGTGKGGVKEFKSVTFASTPGMGSTPAGNGPFTVTARKEVILSAGSVGTPQILQLSGIGSSSLLKSLNIPTLIDNPSVGANLSDHSFTPNLFHVKGDDSFDHVLNTPSLVQDILQEYVVNKTGMFANNIANNFGFKRLPDNSPILRQFGDPAAGPGSPHWEMVPANLFFSPNVVSPTTGAYMTIVLVLIAPTSRGYVKIKSANPFDAPLINPNFLTTQVDIQSIREGVRAVLKFASAPAWSDYITGRFGDKFIAANDDASIDEYIRSITTTIFHPASTAMLTKATDSWGVVNPDFRVKGTTGLRVVDASVFPYQLSCHPQGPLYLLSERAFQIITATTA